MLLCSLFFSLGIFITNLWSSSYEKSGKSISGMDPARGKTFVHARAGRNCDLFFRPSMHWQCHRPWYFNGRRRKKRRGKIRLRYFNVSLTDKIFTEVWWYGIDGKVKILFSIQLILEQHEFKLWVHLYEDLFQ